MSKASTPSKKGGSAVSTPGRKDDFPSLRGSPSRSSSHASTDSPASRQSSASHSHRPPVLSPSPSSPVLLEPIVKPSPCDLSEEVAWMHDLRRRCLQNTIRALSKAGKRQFREVGTWVELLDTLLDHQSEGREDDKKKKGPVTPGVRGGARSSAPVGSQEGNIAKVMTHALELLYAVGDDHGEDWTSEMERSDALEKLQTFIAATPSRYYKRQAALVYLILNGKRKLPEDDPAFTIFHEIYEAYHTRLAPDHPNPYPVSSSIEANSGPLYYARLEALSPLPRSPAPGSPSPGSPSPTRSPPAGRGRAVSPGGGFGTATLRSAAAALEDQEPCAEAIEAGFATRYSDADPFAMLNHANKVLRMCWQPDNLRAVLDLGVVPNALAILGDANPLIAFYGEAFFHGVFARGRFVGQTLDPLYLQSVVGKIRSHPEELDRAEGNLQCLRELIDGKRDDVAPFVEAEVDAGVLQLAFQLLRDIVKKPPAPESGVWHSVPHLTGIIRHIVHYGASAKPNAYKALIDKEGGVKTLAQLVAIIPEDGTGADSACLAICALMEGEKPEPAALYGPVLRIVKRSMGRERHETAYNAAWAGLPNAQQIYEAWEKTQKKTTKK